LNGAFTIVSGCVPMSKRPTIIGIVMGGKWSPFVTLLFPY
jgi:hypothetical protein